MYWKWSEDPTLFCKSLPIDKTQSESTVVAVVVTHNRLDKLKMACSKMLPQAVEAVVVVDNASEDGTKQWLESQVEPKLHPVFSKENLGGAGGFWLGFKTALQAYPRSDWILCFDDDAYPREDVIQNFRATSWNDSVGGVASAVYLPDGRIAEMNRPILNPFGSLKKILKSIMVGRESYHIGEKEYNANKMIPIDAMSFVGAFIRVRLIKEKLGLPRKELFIYADDTIYTLTIKKLGFENVFWSKLKFMHDCQSVETGKKKYRPVWKVYYTLRNGVQVYRELAGPYYLFPLCFKLTQLLRATLYYENKKRYLFFLSWGLKDGLKKRFDVPHKIITSFMNKEPFKRA